MYTSLVIIGDVNHLYVREGQIYIVLILSNKLVKLCVFLCLSATIFNHMLTAYQMDGICYSIVSGSNKTSPEKNCCLLKYDNRSLLLLRTSRQFQVCLSTVTTQALQQ